MLPLWTKSGQPLAVIYGGLQEQGGLRRQEKEIVKRRSCQYWNYGYDPSPKGCMLKLGKCKMPCADYSRRHKKRKAIVKKCDKWQKLYDEEMKRVDKRNKELL